MNQLTTEQRQLMIDGDRKASALMRASRQGRRLRPRASPFISNGSSHATALTFSPGVQVVISTHQRAAMLMECLDSIESAMQGAGVRWNLIIGVDGGDPETMQGLSQFHCGCERMVIFPFPKAPTVAVAKNRAIGLALAHRDEYPWLLLMDDDDLFLRARVTELLAAAIKFGHKFAIGNWETWNSKCGTVSPHPILPEIQGDMCRFGPQHTVIHADLIPLGGHLFDEDVTVWEDVLAWHRLRAQGHEVALIDTPNPVFRQRVFPGPTASRPHDRDVQANHKLHEEALAQRALRYPLRSDVQSVATVCVGERGHDEVRLMLTSLRLFEPKGKRLPVYVVCDPESEALIHSWDLGPVFTYPLATGEWLNETRRNFDSLQQNPFQELRLPSEVMAAKQQAMLHALRHHANVLYMDGDLVLVGDMDGDVFNPRGADACITSHHRSHANHQTHQYGFWQAGCAFISSSEFVRDWVEEFRHDTSYGDQHVLTSLVAKWRVDDMPRGYNIGPWSFYVDDPASVRGPLKPFDTWDDDKPVKPMPPSHHWETECQEFERRVEFRVARSGIYWRGRRVRSFHVHTWPSKSLPCIWRYNENLRLALYRMLSVSPDERHQQLLPFFGPL